MRKFASGLLSIVLAAPAAIPAPVLAGDHVVPPQDLRREIRNASRARRENAERLRTFLHSDLARPALAAANLTAKKADTAITLLSDEELSRLAAQADRLSDDFAAGRLTNAQVTYIILGAILIIVIAIIAH